MRCQLSLYEFYHFYLNLYVIMTGSIIREKGVIGRFFHFIWVFRQKLENLSLHAENDFFKIFEKNVPMGILTKISQNLPGV